jgi:hypothetical protein
VTTKDIRTAHTQVACDICGRTLLRGERSDTYLSGGTRREVCELCTPRAVHAGWTREGLAPERGTRPAPGERGRSLLGRLRRPRTDAEPGEADAAPLGPRVNGNGRRAQSPAPPRERSPEAVPEPRTPRQVRAVPTSIEQRTASAIEHFNQSEFPRTVAGVARSLGAPFVVARPSPRDGGVVTIVVSWELCWYRYEVDLSDGGPSVRAAGQGYELDELEQEDRAEPNAVADEYGTLAPA